MASQNPTPTVDPVSIWVRSQILDSPEQSSKNSLTRKTDVAARYDGQRSILWTSLSEMAGPNRQQFITKMVKNWPYDLEKNANIYPMHVGLLSTALCSSFVAAKINADMFLFDAKTPFLTSVKKCPKSPFVLPIYASGIMYFAFYNLMYQNNILGEDEPCASCALSKISAILVGSGVIFPAITTPALAHYVNMQRNPDMPMPKNLLEFGTMLFTASKPSWSLLPKLAIFQLVIASACTYSLLWSRNRIFNTVDIDSEILTQAITSAKKERSVKSYFNSFFNRISFLRPFADDPTTDAPPTL